MRRAAEAGLAVAALTDHDSVDGIEEARASAPPGLEVIGGAELSSSWRGREIPLLVYGLDPRDEGLPQVLEPLRREDNPPDPPRADPSLPRWTDDNASLLKVLK